MVNADGIEVLGKFRLAPQPPRVPDAASPSEMVANHLIFRLHALDQGKFLGRHAAQKLRVCFFQILWTRKHSRRLRLT